MAVLIEQRPQITSRGCSTLSKASWKTKGSTVAGLHALRNSHKVGVREVHVASLHSGSEAVQEYEDNGSLASNSDLVGSEQTAADQDTIAAVVTGLQSGAIAIIRLSGPDAFSIAQQIFVPSSKPDLNFRPQTHRIYHGHAVDVEGSQLDEVLLLPMRGPRSFTAEDVVEIHGHGGPVCAPRILDACLAAGARRARNGEYTLRAFLNGRLDLTQAEAVAQLVGARSVAAADSALAGLKGGIGSAIADLRLEALTLLADIEARMDFEDEVEEASQTQLQQRMRDLMASLDQALGTRRRGALLQSGLQVALVGRPNVGKSSLLNALSGHDRAIVTAIPGTTRDIVEAETEIDGIPIRLLDTAGLRVATDEVEAIGVDRARAAAARADVLALVYDAQAGWTADDTAILQQLFAPPSTAAAPLVAVQGPVLVVQNKGTGLETLRRAIAAAAGCGQGVPGGRGWAVNERQGEALAHAKAALQASIDAAAMGHPLDFWTLDLHACVQALGEVSGQDVDEDVLDSVFSRFCIGK
ncbi:hypothetical protein WJX73_006534 [Symbiochloris irregularis]|uniref:tRNA modification GTPase MnmE n=1 Tax=Symbiochloris irregularis TaxID=706552 RepID=A0AAW1PK50_9CHLO